MDIPLENKALVEVNTGSDNLAADNLLDITHEICPMTYVRTRLALDRLVSRQTLLVTLRGDEPRRNVAATAVAQGHALLTEETGADGITRLLIRRA